jgi:COMPASS component SPP1
MKELAAQAKEMLDAELRIRDGAAGRWGRRRKEGNCVVVLCDGGDGKEEGGGGGGGDLGVGEGMGMDVCY